MQQYELFTVTTNTSPPTGTPLQSLQAHIQAQILQSLRKTHLSTTSCKRKLTSGSTPHQVLYCHTQLAPHNIIRLYLANIQHFLPSQDPRESSGFTAHTVGSFLRGVQKHQPIANGKRLPITTAIFRDMSKPQTFPSLVIQAAIYLALCGFLRPNKFTFTGTGSQ
ncbi:hypothetical protein AB205_0080770, partial [Aquarana catesbeiana]